LPLIGAGGSANDATVRGIAEMPMRLLPRSSHNESGALPPTSSGFSRNRSATHTEAKQFGIKIDKTRLMKAVNTPPPKWRSNMTRLALSQLSRTTSVERPGTANSAVIANLLAKIEALLQHPTDTRETILNVGPLQLDLLTRTVSRDGRWIDLVPREYQLLEYMMRHQGYVVTRAMLFREVWNYKFVPESNLVDVHMGRLRRKIDRPDEAPMIYSIRGQGFVLQAPV
jgi:Transcriptional regulatory protein, C terminal